MILWWHPSQCTSWTLLERTHAMPTSFFLLGSYLYGANANHKRPVIGISMLQVLPEEMSNKHVSLFFSLAVNSKKNTTAAPISVVQYKIQQKISRSFLWDYDHALCCHVVLSSKSRGSCYDMSSCQLLDFKWVSKELYVFSLKSFIFLFGSTLELKATKKENHGQNDHQIRHPS